MSARSGCISADFAKHSLSHCLSASDPPTIRLESQGAHMTARWRGNGVPIDEPLAMLVCGSADVPARSAPASSSANRGTSGP